MYAEFEKMNCSEKRADTIPVQPSRFWLMRGLRHFTAYHRRRRIARDLAHLDDRLRADIGYPRQPDPMDFWQMDGFLVIKPNK